MGEWEDGGTDDRGREKIIEYNTAQTGETTRGALSRKTSRKTGLGRERGAGLENAEQRCTVQDRTPCCLVHGKKARRPFDRSSEKYLILPSHFLQQEFTELTQWSPSLESYRVH